MDMNIVKKDAEILMRKLGASQQLKGFDFAVSAIEIICETPTMMHTICALYEEVAKKHDTTSSRVERAMRHLFGVIWDKGNRSLLNTLACHELSNKPANGTFLDMLVFGVRNDMGKIA